jgi:hypothetical protein
MGHVLFKKAAAGDINAVRGAQEFHVGFDPSHGNREYHLLLISESKLCNISRDAEA